MGEDPTQVDPDLLSKHGRNLEERLTELASMLEKTASQTTLKASDFGTTQEAHDAARAYHEASTALAEAIAALSKVGKNHATVMRLTATALRETDEESAAKTEHSDLE